MILWFYEKHHYSCLENTEVPPTLPGENSGIQLSSLSSVTVLQSNPGQITSEQTWSDKALPRLSWGILQSAKHFECTKVLRTSWHSSPAWVNLFMEAIFAPLLRGGRRRISTWLLLTQHFIMQFIALLDSGVRFTEGLEDWGIPRIIWRIF